MLKLHGETAEKRHIHAANKVLSDDGVVLVPTETGYCFVGKAGNEKVFKRFLDLRQAHPKNKPFSLLCCSISQIAEVAAFDTAVFRVAKKVLPGPYTLILNATRETPKYAGSSKQKSVGVRMSNYEAARQICEAFGASLLVTSVTDTSELQAEHYFDGDEIPDDAWWARGETIERHFKNKIDLCFCAPEAIPLRSSTIIDFTAEPPELVRDGGWPMEDLGFIS